MAMPHEIFKRKKYKGLKILYEYSFIKDWKKYFDKLPENIKFRVVKKINYIIEYSYKRHLKGSAEFLVS